jgi:hypothetical protein
MASIVVLAAAAFMRGTDKQRRIDSFPAGGHARSMDPMDPLPTPAVTLPCTGHALHRALRHHDVRTLATFTATLRVAGYRFDPALLASALLRHGQACVRDAFGHPVLVHPQPHS